MRTHTFVYVIGPDIGPQKVGIAFEPEHRLKGLQTGCPFNLKIHARHEVLLALARKVERAAHKALASQSQRGEWFNVTPREASLAIEEAILSAQGGEMPDHAADGLVRLYRVGGITYPQLEAGLAYREVRREASDQTWGKGNRTVRQMERRYQAGAHLGRIEGEVVRRQGIEGLKALLDVAYKGEQAAANVRLVLRRSLDVVAGLLDAAKCA